MIGKILIIKSLILPKFTFLATSGIVPQKYKKEIESCCFKFIWKNKIDKVKRTTLINTYEKGGLNMIDFESYFNSLKASWVKRLTDTYYENWKVIPEKYFNIVGKNWLVFKMNIDDIKNVPNVEHIPEFYRDVIISWVKSGGGQTKTPKRFQDIRKQVIWGNKFIKFGTKCLLFKKWINSDLIYINDIIDEEGKLSEEFILQKLKYKMNWISEFAVLKKCLPKTWSMYLSKEQSVKSIVNIKKQLFVWNSNNVIVSNITNKDFYNSLIQQKVTTSIGVSRWLKFFNIEDTLNVSHLYYFIFYYLNENKLKVFRWKLLQFIVPTKKLLFTWKISESNFCSFCNIEEDYDHLFISCNYLLNFWNKVQKFLKSIHFEINVTLKHLVLGYKLFDKEYFYFNYILTIIGFSIYKANYLSEQKTKQIDIFNVFRYELLKYKRKCITPLVKNVLQKIDSQTI